MILLHSTPSTNWLVTVLFLEIILFAMEHQVIFPMPKKQPRAILVNISQEVIKQVIQP